MQTTARFGPSGLRYLLAAGLVTAGLAPAMADTWDSHRLAEAVTRPMQGPASDVFAQAQVIATQDLAELRGGFSIAGLEMSFGATLRTMIDNVRLETVLNFTEAGINIASQSLHNTNQIGNDITEQTQQIFLVGPGIGKSVLEVAPEGVDIPGLKNFSGAVVNDAKGFTAALYNITHEAILSTVVGNASNRVIRHELDLRLDIGNMDAVRAAQLRSTIMDSLLMH